MFRKKRNLSCVDILKGVDKSIVRELSKNCAYKDFTCGDIVIRKGDSDTDIYFVLSGQVAVFNYVDAVAQVFLTEFNPGDLFGELAVIDGEGRSAWVVATEDSTIATLSGSNFVDSINAHKDITQNVLKHFSRVIRGAGTRTRNLSLMSTQQRIVLELLRLSGAGSQVSGTTRIEKMPGHSVLASFAATTRDVVAETMGELMREKIISRMGRSMLIHDIKRLRSLANEQEYRKLDSEEGMQTLFKEIYSGG